MGRFNGGSSLSIENSEVRADVTGASSNRVGGLVGLLRPNATLTARDVSVAGTMQGKTPVGGLVGFAIQGGGDGPTLDVGRTLVTATLGASNGDAEALVGILADATEVVRLDAFVPEVVDGVTPSRGTPVGAAERRDPRTYLDAGWSLVNGAAGSATWRLCAATGAPVLAWTGTPGGCEAVDLADGLGVEPSGRALVVGVPFDVTVSVVDADGVAFPAAQAGRVVLTGSGGTPSGGLRFADAAPDAGPPEVAVAAGAEVVTFTDVVYGGVSGAEGGDVTFTATGSGGLDGLVGTSLPVSVRDVVTTLEIDAEEVVADGVSEAAVVVTVRRADDTPIQGTPVTVTTTIGTFVEAGEAVGASVERPTDAEGRVELGLRSDGVVGTAEVVVSCPDACDVAGEVAFVEASMPFTLVPGNAKGWVYPGFGPSADAVEIRVGSEGVDPVSVVSASDVRGPIRLEELENGVTYAVEVDALDVGGVVQETRTGVLTPGPVDPPLLVVAVDGSVAPTVERGADGTLVTVRMRVEHEEAAPLERAWFVVELPDGEDVRVVRATNVSRGAVAPESVAWRWTGDAWPAGEVLTFDVTFEVAP